MTDILSAPRGELIVLVYELFDKIGALEAENAHLRELLHQKGDGTLTKKDTPSFVKASVKKKRKKVRAKREGSYHRAKEKPTKKVFHSFETCPDCGGNHLGKPSVGYTRQIIDLPQIQYQVIEHVVCKRWCFDCRKRTMPKVDFSSRALGSGWIGLKLASTIVLMKDRLRLSVYLIQKYLQIFFNLKLSEGEIVEICHRSAAIGKPNYQKLLGELQSGDVVHGDETGGRKDGKNGYYWSFSNPNTHILLYRKSRGSGVVKELVGEDGSDFEGVLVTDFYTAYNAYTGFHQRCWVHLLRDIKELKKNFPKHPPLNTWAQKVRIIYQEAKAYTGPPDNTPAGLSAQIRIEKQRYFEEKLKETCLPYRKKDIPMGTLCGRIITYLPELFVFVRFPHIPSDNNAAERILRHIVIMRKVLGGTRSAHGSETRTILTSLLDTWQLRGLNVFDQCKLMLATCQ